MTDTLNLPELPRECSTVATLTRIESDKDVLLYTADQLRAYATAAVLAERERCAKIADDARATRVESAAQNNGRASDFAFGYVNAAEEIASAIRGSSPASQGEGE